MSVVVLQVMVIHLTYFFVFRFVNVVECGILDVSPLLLTPVGRERGKVVGCGQQVYILGEQSSGGRGV